MDSSFFNMLNALNNANITSPLNTTSTTHDYISHITIDQNVLQKLAIKYDIRSMNVRKRVLKPIVTEDTSVMNDVVNEAVASTCNVSEKMKSSNVSEEAPVLNANEDTPQVLNANEDTQVETKKLLNITKSNKQQRRRVSKQKSSTKSM